MAKHIARDLLKIDIIYIYGLLIHSDMKWTMYRRIVHGFDKV